MATKTIYSNRGTKREIQKERYEEFKTAGWHDTNPLDTPEETPVEVPETPEIETPVIPKEVSITPEQLAPVELPKVEEPWYGLKDTFGEEWTPPPVFEQLGLVDQGIYGAVRVKGMIDTYTIGPGGRLETPESFQERFGTLEQAGIVNEVSMEEAKRLGINIEADSLMSDITEEIPEFLTAEMTPEQKAQVGTDILAAAEIKYGVEGLKKEKDTATTNLINAISGMWEKFEEAKEGKEEDLKMEEKNKAISDAQTAYTKVKSVYDKYINELTHSTMTTAHIGGLQAKARSQMAVELAPLSAAIQIAQGNWDRAKEILDDFSDDWKTAQEWNLQAAQMKIDMLGENLSEAQEKSRFEAQNKLDWFREDYQRKLDTIEEVKKLSLMYSQAGVLISDSWEDAYRKIQPFVKDEADFEKKMRDLELKIAEKKLTDTTGGYAPSAAKKLYNELGGQEGTGKTFSEWYEEQSGEEDIVGDVAQWEYDLGVRPGMTTKEANKILRESPGDNFYQSLVDYFTEDKSLGLSRKDVEKREKGNLTAEHIKALDQIYGETEESRSFWGDLGTVIDWANPFK